MINCTGPSIKYKTAAIHKYTIKIFLRFGMLFFWSKYNYYIMCVSQDYLIIFVAKCIRICFDPIYVGLFYWWKTSTYVIVAASAASQIIEPRLGSWRSVIDRFCQEIFGVHERREHTLKVTCTQTHTQDTSIVCQTHKYRTESKYSKKFKNSGWRCLWIP